MPESSSLSGPQVWAATFVILGTVAWVISSLSVIVGQARARGAAPSIGALFFPAGLSVWAGAALATACASPLEFSRFLAFAAVPILVGWALTFHGPVAAVLARIQPHQLVAIQTYRAAGLVFLFPYYTSEILTAGFAYPAAIGDAITGLLAPLVAYLVWKDPVRHRRWFIAWSFFGILDLFVAPASARVFGFEQGSLEATFPVTAIPLFLGPPFGILIHIVTLRCFSLQR